MSTQEQGNRFEVGDKVLSRVTAQGLVQGAEYEVMEIERMPTPFGYRVVYHLKNEADDTMRMVSNGHLILDQKE